MSDFQEFENLKVIGDENRAKNILSKDRQHEIESKKRLIKGKVVSIEDIEKYVYERIKSATNDFTQPMSLFIFGKKANGKTRLSVAIQNFFIDLYKGNDDRIISLSERWLIHNVLSNNKNVELFFDRLEHTDIIVIDDCFEPDNFALFWENNKPAVYQRQMYREFIDRIYRLETKLHTIMIADRHFSEVFKTKDEWLQKRFDILYSGKTLHMTEGDK